RRPRGARRRARSSRCRGLGRPDGRVPPAGSSTDPRRRTRRDSRAVPRRAGDERVRTRRRRARAGRTGDGTRDRDRLLVIGLLVSGLLMGQWLTGGLEEATFGPAFFLPGIGIGFVGADAAATVGLHGIAELFFGVGIASWVLISSVTLNRMFFRPRLAPSLF